MFFTYLRSKSNRGFSLIELLVSLGIVTVLMRVVLFDYSTFNDKVALSSAGQEMAIAIRQAQTYGLNVKESSVGSGLFGYAYGIYFNPTASNSTYIIFADRSVPPNQRYDAGEAVETITLRNGVTISTLCNQAACPPNAAVRSMTIIFLRPNPDANISFFDSTGTKTFASQVTGKVRLISKKARTLDIVVESTGQVYAQ